MKTLLSLAVFLILTALPFPVTSGHSVPGGLETANEIDVLMEGAINRGLIAGGVVLIGNDRDNVFCRAYGRLSAAPEAGPVEPDSLFDIASLTKVVATAPSVLKLVEEGRIGLDDPVVRWFPEFIGKKKDDLLVRHLLTHTSGLRDISPSAPDFMRKFIERTASITAREKPGSRFHYTDINFILLGELVRRASGVPLNVYAAEHLFLPLRMLDTGFNPGGRDLLRCAATLDYDNSLLFGRVQDHTAFLLGGVSGHSGLFSTAYDLSLFCRTMLNKGTLDGECVLARKTVEQATTPYSCRDGKALRGLGWDIASPFSSPRGRAFSGASFGHTGYSGCSIWIDPEQDVFVVFLAARRDYKRVKDFNQLRGDLSTAAVRLLADDRTKLNFTRKSN